MSVGQKRGWGNSGRTFRWLSLGTGLLVLAWLPLEDSSEAWVLALASLITGLLAAGMFLKLSHEHRPPGWFLPILGVLAGSLVGILAVLLMAIKTGLHGHPVADYTPDQIQNTLSSTALWMIIGGLVGSGIELLRRNH